MSSGDHFTYEERKRLVTLIEAGYTRDEIAQLMERSRSCIDRQCTRHGLTRQRLPKAPPPKVVKDYEIPPRVRTDHLAHCQLVMGADCAGSPHGYGFPHIAHLPALVRVAA